MDSNICHEQISIIGVHQHRHVYATPTSTYTCLYKCTAHTCRIVSSCCCTCASEGHSDDKGDDEDADEAGPGIAFAFDSAACFHFSISFVKKSRSRSKSVKELRKQ